MGIIDPSQLDPIGETPIRPSFGGRIISEADLDPIERPSRASLAFEGLLDAPGAIYDAVTSIPSGVSNIFNSLTSPVDSLNDGTLEKTLRGAGTLASGAAGAGFGATLGAPLAPFTFGLSVPVGAALGGAAGLLGFDKLNQATGSDAPTTLADDLDKLSYNFGQGIGGTALVKGTAGGVKLAGKATGKIASTLDDAAQNLREKALGIQYGEKLKGLNRFPSYIDDAGNVVPLDELDQAAAVEAPIQKQLSSLKAKGLLDGAPNNAESLKIFIEKQKQPVARRVGTLITEADKAIGKNDILPEFTKTQEYINSFRDSKRIDLQKQFDSIIDDYANHEGNGFVKLTKFTDKLQKETNFDQVTPKEVTQLKRFAAYELRKAAESAFDDAIPSKKGAFASENESFNSLSSVSKTLNKRVAKLEPSIASFIKGGSLPTTAIGAMLSGPLGVMPAAAVTGTSLVANALRQGLEAKYPLSASRLYENLGGKIEGVRAVASPIGKLADAVSLIPPEVIQPAVQAASGLTHSPILPTPHQEQGKKSSAVSIQQKRPSPDFTSDPDLSKSRNSAYASAYKRSSFMDTVLDRAEGKSMDKAPVAVIEEQIDADPYYSALYEAESGRNPLAKNPTSSATGGFQFIKRTAQSLGLDDPTDLGKSFQAVQKLTKEIDAVANGDPFLRYAGHYLGSPLLKKWLEKKSLTDTEEEQVRYLKAKALPRFQKIYKRIAQKKAGVLEA